MNEQKTLIKAVKIAMAIKEVNQSDLAELTGIKKQNISRMVSGEKNINLQTFIKICNALGLEINISFDGKKIELQNNNQK